MIKINTTTMFRKIALFAGLLFTTTTFAQVKGTIQLGSSSHFRDIVSLTPKVQIKDWSVFLNASYGGQLKNSVYSQYTQAQYVSPYTYSYDSLEYRTYANRRYHYINLDIGGAHHYSIFKLPYYYSGASGGITFEIDDRKYTHQLLDVYHGPENYIDASQGSMIYPVLEESTSSYTADNIAWRINLFTGMDIPISNRLLINAELNAGFISSSWEVDDFWVFKFIPSVRGGVKYLLTKPSE